MAKGAAGDEHRGATARAERGSAHAQRALRAGHGPRRVRAKRRRALRGLACGLLALGFVAFGRGAADVAQAQLSPMQSLDDLPALPPVDPDVDPYPFDPFLMLRSYLRERLPAGWWARDPVYGAGVFSVVVNIPESWRGNPSSAMLRLCPEARSKLWDRVSVIELRPMYRKTPWAPVMCRR